MLISNGLAAMGFALPAAVAAKLVHPDRNVVAVSGDGGFLMNVQELETARRLKLAIVNVIWDASRVNRLEAGEALRRDFGADFTNPDFVGPRRVVRPAGLALRVGRGLSRATPTRAHARRPLAPRRPR